MNFPEQLIRDAITNADSEFDSHDIIRELGHKNQKLYIEALATANGDRPFQVLHSQFGIAIKSICQELGYQGQGSSSLDIFGQESACIRWKKM